MKRRQLLAATAGVAVTGCAAPQLSDSQSEKPELLNKDVMHKFGIRVGEVILSFEKS